MLLSLQKLIRRHRLNIDGVLHLGAHLGEEAEVYHDLGCEPVFWVEANPMLIEPLRAHVEQFTDQYVVEGLVTDHAGDETVLHVSRSRHTPRGVIDHQSSSIFSLGQHREFSPDVYFAKDIRLTSTTVDYLVGQFEMDDFNFMNLDLQGAELLALKGAEEALEHTRAVYTEVNRDQVYVGCAQIEEITTFLGDRGFELVEVEWELNAQTWGDALYVRTR